MAQLQPEKIALVGLTVFTVVLAGIGLSTAMSSMNTQSVVIAAGPGKAESAVFMRALKAVVERHYPHIKISVQDTSDTAESLKRLENGTAQFAASQADANTGPSARLVAVLFEDVFQLLAHREAKILQFTDLKGKRIALATGDAQYQSFIFLAAHFGMTPKDFTFVGHDDDDADLLFARGDADAIFRVRALDNSALERTARDGGVDFVPIGDAQAMHIRFPAYTATVIPKGTYPGNPPLPANDIETVGSKHTLLARADVPDDVVAAIVQVLMERRPELGVEIAAVDPSLLPLLAEVQPPTAAMGLGLGIHPGAVSEYAGGKPPFIQRHADMVAAIIGIALLAGMWLWVGARTVRRNQTRRLDSYNTKIAQLIAHIEACTSDRLLTPIRTELMLVFRMAMTDLAHNDMSEESFQTFHILWQTAFDTLHERRAAIRHRQVVTDAAQTSSQSPPDATIPAAEKHLWRFAKMLQRNKS